MDVWYNAELLEFNWLHFYRTYKFTQVPSKGPSVWAT